jgi:hypothetical protein
MQDPVNSGSYNSDTNVLMVGHRMPSNPVYKEFFEKYPMAHAQRVRQTMGHELTHLMQNEERAIGGTGPEYILRALNDTPEPELERHLTRGGFLQSVGAGDNPEKLFQMYVDAGTDKGTLRQLHNYMTALKDGRMSVEDAYEQGKFHESSASNVMKRLENKEKLVDLRKRRFLEQMPEEIQQSAHKYGVENQTGNNPFAVQRDAYGLYRANAGENQAESAGQRVGMSIKQRREEPFQFESGIPLDFLHNVR